MSLSHSHQQGERSQPPQGHEAFAYRFQALAQENADVFWWLSPDGSMQEVCPSWQTFTGQRKRKCLGRGWLDALHPANQPQIEETVRQAVTSARPTEMECHIRRGGGAYRLVRVRAIPVRTPEGELREVLACGTDITRQELAGQMSEAEEQLALKASGVGMWDWDLVTNQINWTNQGKALLGLSPDIPINYEGFLAMLYPEDREPVDRFLARVVAEHADYQTEYRILWPDGSIHWLSDRGHVIADTQGHPVHMLGAVIDITDLKQTEEQVTTILESITNSFVHVDPAWRYTYVNRRAEEFVGKSREDMLGQRIWDVSPELLGTAIERQAREAMETQQMVYFEAWHPLWQRWLEIHAYPDQNGLSLYFQDITERKHAEERLQEAHQRITTILESITDAFSHVDTQWRYTYVNRGLEKMLGKKREEVVGQSFWDLLPELLGTPFEHAYREAMATQQAMHIEGFHPSFRRWLEIYLYPTPDGLSFYLHDVTERKQAEEALQESEARFRGLVDSNIIGITVSESEGMIREANDAFLSLVGYTQEDLAAGRMQWTALTPPEYQAQHTQALEELLTTGKVQPFEKELVTKAGKRVPVLVGITLVRREGSKSLVIGFVVDLTARKEIERQKDLMLSMTSHELKTPLAALKGTFQLLQRRVKRLGTQTDHLSPEVSAFFNDLMERLAASARQVDVQTHLINDLLDVSRITANTLELSLDHCDLASIVRETVEDLRVTAPSRSLLLELPDHTTVMVLADRARISQVVTNYLTNAIRYSSADQPIHIGLTIREGVARVWVRDQGPGLTEEAQKELWQRFHQVKGVPVQSGSGKGLGLGLYICQTLITQHQGEVGVESRPGEGSTFWFSLPMVK